MSRSQAEMVREHLEAWASITPLEALDRYGIMRLAAVIFDLKKEGMDIETVNCKGNGKRWAKYRLRKPTTDPDSYRRATGG